MRLGEKMDYISIDRIMDLINDLELMEQLEVARLLDKVINADEEWEKIKEKNNE